MPPRVISLSKLNGPASPLLSVKKPSILVSPPKKPLWRSERIEVEAKEKPFLRTVEAKVHGSVAVHAGWGDNERDKWVVVSVSLRLAIGTLTKESDAIRLAEYLEKNYSEAMRCATKERALSKLPSWFKDWCKGMTSIGAWTEPITEGK